MRGEEALAFPLEKQNKSHVSTNERDQDPGSIHP
jgi:hypothetical protein